MYKEIAGFSSWPNDTDPIWNGSTAGNPTIGSIIFYNADFREIMRTRAVNEGLGTDNGWNYDNDGDTYGGCSNSSSGVNIYISNVTNDELALAIDAQIDDNNLACGKLRKASTGSMVYNIDRRQ